MLRADSVLQHRVCGMPVGYALALLFVVALVVRLGAVFVMGAPPEKDALQYHDIATNLVTGHGYALRPDIPTTLRPPVYPAFLAAVYGVAGVDYRAALYTQAFMQALLLLPLFWFGRRLSGSDGVGLLGATLFAVHPSFEVVSRLYAENLLIPLMLALLILLHKAFAGRKQHWGYAIGAGLVAGLMGLTKPEYGMLGLGMWMLAMLWPVSRRQWRIWSAMLLGCLIVLAGWQVRNVTVGPEEEAHLGSKTIMVANCPILMGDGWWPVTDMQQLEQKRLACYAFLDQHAGDVQQVSLQRLWREHPASMAELVLNRALLLWVSPPVGSSQLAAVSGSLKWVAFFANLAFILIAFGALLRMLTARPELFSFFAVAVYMTVIYGLLHAIRRYGYPFVPELCLLAGWGFWTGSKWLRDRMQDVGSRRDGAG